MRMIRPTFVGLILMAGAVAGAPPLPAQPAQPDAADLIARHVEARGGRDALLAPRTARSRGTIEMSALGAEGTIEYVMTRDGRMVMTMTVPGMGEMRMGYDGDVGWSVDDLMGPRLLEGAELAAMRDMANPLADIRDASLLAAAETVERREMGGEPCWLVRLEWQSGRESFDCYHVDSGLAIATIDTHESPMGAMEVRSHIEEYREMNGVLIPARTTQDVMGALSVIRIDEVTHDDVEPSELELPAAIRALLNR